MSIYEQGYPHIKTLKADESIYICGCGKTGNAPNCDGSHSGTGKEPFAHTADKEGDVFICGCGKSESLPWCDGSHNK